MQLAPYCGNESTSRRRRTDDQELGFGPLAESESRNKGCGGGNDLGIEREKHLRSFDIRLESTKASRETINGVSTTSIKT